MGPHARTAPGPPLHTHTHLQPSAAPAPVTHTATCALQGLHSWIARGLQPTTGRVGQAPRRRDEPQVAFVKLQTKPDGRAVAYALRPTSLAEMSHSLEALESSATSSDTWLSNEPVVEDHDQ